jgi:elongation factor P
MAIEAGDFKNGLTLEIEGHIYVVLEFMHVKPGKGAAILKTKMKDLRTGNVVERNFNTNTKFEAAEVRKVAVQYSYEAGGTYYFMDMETFETYELSEAQLGDNKYFILEGMELSLRFYESEVLDVVMPDKVVLTITETTPAAPGASPTSTKDATLETGHKIKVPQFIKEGEKVIISTIDGTYCGRA